MTSPIYRYPFLYQGVIRLLYFPHYTARYRTIAGYIGDARQVVDLCAGDCAIYPYLATRPVSYLACDISPAFLHAAERRGIPCRQVDIRTQPIPPGEVVMMLGSLYQFLPEVTPVVEKIIQAAEKKVLIVEPVRNLAQSANPVLRWSARYFTRLDSGMAEYRFTAETLHTLLSPYGFQSGSAIAGGRDRVFILKK
ncbi:MAG: hypothetical protein RBU29_01015 [bacterium]|jgi:hypothetical protein|nr:hypothetical protein [bacterium]